MNAAPCEIILGDTRAALSTLADGSCRCCVTSPPYWGLRDYGVDGQMGLEPTPEDWVAGMVAVFAQVHRVLTKDGTLWLNVGDAYNAGGRGGNSTRETSTLQGSKESQEASKIKRYARKPSQTAQHGGWTEDANGAARVVCPGLKPKDLIGLPWMLAFALRADGWYLRSDIIWHKPNPMPESVTDRPTKAHEYIFLLSRSSRYYFDADAIKEPSKTQGVDRLPPIGGVKHAENGTNRTYSENRPEPRTLGDKGRAADPITTASAAGAKMGRGAGWRNDPKNFVAVSNARTVWTIPTQPYKGAHYATFPRELAARCIKAGSAAGDRVLDPFLGTGTVVAEALLLGRRGVGVELNPESVRLAQERIAALWPLFAQEKPRKSLSKPAARSSRGTA